MQGDVLMLKEKTEDLYRFQLEELQSIHAFTSETYEKAEKYKNDYGTSRFIENVLVSLAEAQSRTTEGMIQMIIKAEKSLEKRNCL